jgi:hypothetical protein
VWSGRGKEDQGCSQVEKEGVFPGRRKDDQGCNKVEEEGVIQEENRRTRDIAK